MFKLANLINAALVAAFCFVLTRGLRRERHKEVLHALLRRHGANIAAVESLSFVGFFGSALLSPTFTVAMAVFSVMPSMADRSGGRCCFINWYHQIAARCRKLFSRRKAKIVVVKEAA